MKSKILIYFSLLLVFTACISTKSTIKNINDNALGPQLNEINNYFIITKTASDKKYGYDSDYPVNVGFTDVADGNINEVRFLMGITGPEGQKLKFKIKEVCCPYPTKKTATGAGMLDVFEITYEGLQKPIILYVNKYEKSELMVPVGFKARVASY